MRRSFATQLAANGVPLPTIMRIGGWRTTTVLERYYLLGVPDGDVQKILGGLL